MSDKHDSHAGAKTFRGQSVLAVVGLLLLVALPFIPWLSRGISQRSAANAIKSSGGLASYGKRLLDGADYVKDENDGARRACSPICLVIRSWNS